MGDLNDVELADTCEAVKQIAETQKSFSINLNKIVYGPPKKMPPRYVWVNGEKSEELQELKNELEELLLEKVNFKPEGRGFAPHITLARILETAFRQIEPDERPEINEDIDFMFSVESIEVMESEMKRGGPQYTIIESHNLQ
jgi:2'-5' RNA ligase